MLRQILAFCYSQITKSGTSRARGFFFYEQRHHAIRYHCCAAASIGAGSLYFCKIPFFRHWLRERRSLWIDKHPSSSAQISDGSEASGSLSFIPVLASAAIAPHWVSVVAVALRILAAQVLARKTFLKTVFNRHQECACARACDNFAYSAVGELPLRRIGDSGSLSLFALFLVFFLTNSICVSGAIGIANGKNPWAIWKENTLGCPSIRLSFTTR